MNKAEITIKSLAEKGPIIQKHLDSLWDKAKEANCPKEFMDWLMWVEHEVSRTTWHMSYIEKEYLKNKE